jgi:hypothetical protein
MHDLDEIEYYILNVLEVNTTNYPVLYQTLTFPYPYFLKFFLDLKDGKINLDTVNMEALLNKYVNTPDPSVQSSILDKLKTGSNILPSSLSLNSNIGSFLSTDNNVFKPLVANAFTGVANGITSIDSVINKVSNLSKRIKI